MVEISTGKIEGMEKRGALQFRGIPYAAPPVGERRFAPPQPHEPWAGVRETKEYGPIAPQNPSAFHTNAGAELPPTAEDNCLTLNVWTPSTDGARPVMVWFHGGAFIIGDGRTAWYDGTKLSRRDVVVVTCNYRLGALGYLHLEGLPGPDAADGFARAGNAGLLDQIAVLEWVQENIAQFGGDPGNVTAFGESAGAMSIGALLGTPSTSRLFHKAILQSGACEHVHDVEAATRVAEEVVSELGFDPAKPADLDRLREVPVEQILGAQKAVNERRWGTEGVSLAFQPVVDGDVLPRHPLDALRDGSRADVPVLIGCTREEMKLFTTFDPEISQLTEDELADRAEQALGDDVHQVLAAYHERLGADVDTAELWEAILTARAFRVPALHLLEAHLPHQASTYCYEFAWASPAWGGMLGSSHAMDITFTFDNLTAPGATMLVGEPDDAANALATACADAWTAFARTGAPSADGLPEWPAWEPDRRATMILDAECRVDDDPWGFDRRAWEPVMG